MQMDYIKLSRKLLEWEWYSDINTCRLFVHMLLKANWKKGKFQGVEIPRGSFASSLNRLSEDTGLSVQSIRTCIKKLKSTGELTVNQHGKSSIFTINNYCDYQDINTVSNNQSTEIQQGANTEVTTIEERKKERRKENIKDNMSSGTSADHSSLKDKSAGTDNDHAPYAEIVDYLNHKAGTSYRSTSKDTQKHIRARLKEKFTVEDFYRVIDKKTKEWKGTEMEKFLRPGTLFGTKFESYLNQKEGKKAPGSTNRFNNFHQREYDFEEYEKKLLRSSIP